MKQVFSIFIASVLCLSLAACAGKPAMETTVPEFIMTEPAAAQTTAPEAQEQTVEITMENWQQYFDLVTAAEPLCNDQGQIESWDFFYGVFLKPQYAEGFVSGQVDFEIQFDTEHRAASLTGDSWELGEPVGEILESDFQQKTFGLEDFRHREDLPAQSDFIGTIAGQAYCGSVREAEDGSLIADYPANGKLLHAEGSLTFLS